MHVNLKKTLELQGKNWQYKGKIIHIEQCKVVSNLVVVITNEGTRNFQESEFNQFLKEIEETALPPTNGYAPKAKKTNMVSAGSDLVMQVPSEEIPVIKSVLMEMIHKVKNDKDSIEQAKTISMLAGTMINVFKTQMQAVELSNKL